MAKKSAPMMLAPTTLLLMVVAILVIAYIIVSSTAKPAPSNGGESLQSSSDLAGATDSLDSVNIDSVDTGLNEIGAEVSRY